MKLQSIKIYPVKGLGGIELDHCEVQRRGLALDRRWMLVDEGGKFLTQRSLPNMATIQIELRSDGLTASHLSHGTMNIPFCLEGATREVQIWRNQVEAVICCRETSRWFSSVLGLNCTLVQMPESTIRPTNEDFSEPGDHVSFADGYPITLACQSSLDDLNRRLAAPVPMSRFRANLVIGAENAPWEEDGWKLLKLGGIRFRVAKPCGRCIVTTIDQDTGTPNGPEPLTTLAQFRNSGSSLDFSVNLIPEGEGCIRIDDELTVL